MQAVQDGGMQLGRRRGWLWAAGALIGLCVMTACSASSTTTSAAVPSPTRPASGTPARTATVVPARTATAAPASTSASLAPVAQVTVTHVRTADGSLVTVAIFRGPVHYVLHNGSMDPGSLAAGLVQAGPVRYRLHCGSQDPGPAALSVVRAGPRIGPAEQRQVVAAFNGGFLLSAGAGGYEQEGHVISPLRAGLASLVIDASGAAHVGVWGAGLPEPHEAVVSVRQNLPPLVTGGKPSPAAADWTAWGATLGGGEYVARSALGETASGQLVYAASMSTTPGDLAAALVQAGSRTAMELDINPEWVQLDAAGAPGSALLAVIPGQVRPASQYLAGWTRDFITVLSG